MHLYTYAPKETRGRNAVWDVHALRRCLTRIGIIVAAEGELVHVKGKKYWIKGELKFISNAHILHTKTILQDSENPKM
jgi:hypothetical protein